MRVALLSRGAHPLHAPGGMERAVYLQAKHLRARGAETVLFTRPPTQEGTFPGEVVTVRYGREARHGSVLDRTLRYPGFSLRVGQAVAERVRAGTVDVVDAQGLTALGYARLRLQEGLGAPLLMNPQGLEEHKTRGLKRLALTRLRTLSREAARLADRVVATDEATKDEVPRLLGVPAEKVVVLPNGIDTEEIASLTPADPERVVMEAIPALAGAFPVFLSVGRLVDYKGFLDVAEALARAAHRKLLPARWAWVVCGEGPAAATLVSRIEKERADAETDVYPHLHVLGRTDERLLHALYATADVFVHAPHYEGSSLVTLEAMEHGLPVLATRAGGIPDKVRDGDTGRLVDPGDVEALAAGLGELADDAARRTAWGDAGRRLVRERFSASVLVERTLALYETLVAEARTR